MQITTDAARHFSSRSAEVQYSHLSVVGSGVKKKKKKTFHIVNIF